MKASLCLVFCYFVIAESAYLPNGWRRNNVEKITKYHAESSHTSASTEENPEPIYFFTTTTTEYPFEQHSTTEPRVEENFVTESTSTEAYATTPYILTTTQSEETKGSHYHHPTGCNCELCHSAKNEDDGMYQELELHITGYLRTPKLGALFNALLPPLSTEGHIKKPVKTPVVEIPAVEKPLFEKPAVEKPVVKNPVKNPNSVNHAFGFYPPPENRKVNKRMEQDIRDI